MPQRILVNIAMDKFDHQQIRTWLPSKVGCGSSRIQLWDTFYNSGNSPSFCLFACKVGRTGITGRAMVKLKNITRSWVQEPTSVRTDFLILLLAALECLHPHKITTSNLPLDFSDQSLASYLVFPKHKSPLVGLFLFFNVRPLWHFPCYTLSNKCSNH